jgi:hypothetical protein
MITKENYKATSVSCQMSNLRIQKRRPNYKLYTINHRQVRCKKKIYNE